MCDSNVGVVYACVRACFTNEEQLSNQSTLFKPAPLGSNRKYSQDFLSLSQALKQDTSAGPAYRVLTSFTTAGVRRLVAEHVFKLLDAFSVKELPPFKNKSYKRQQCHR